MTADYDSPFDAGTAAAWIVLGAAEIIDAIQSGDLPVTPEDAGWIVADLRRAMTAAEPVMVAAGADSISALSWVHAAALTLQEHEAPDRHGIQQGHIALLLSCRRDARRLGISPDRLPLPSDPDLSHMGSAGSA